ncbi:hypothetical protein GW7_13402, partial [Heterocephalus glaber]
HCWWEYKLVQLIQKSVWRFLQKLKLELPKIVFAILSLFLFQMNFWIFFSRSKKYASGISIGIELNL